MLFFFFSGWGGGTHLNVWVHIDSRETLDQIMKRWFDSLKRWWESTSVLVWPAASTFYQDSEQRTQIYMKGCVPQFEKWLQDNLTVVAGIFIGIALLQVSTDMSSFSLLYSCLVFFFFCPRIQICFLLQIFGICLAQNLVSDIEAVRESW